MQESVSMNLAFMDTLSCIHGHTFLHSWTHFLAFMDTLSCIHGHTLQESVSMHKSPAPVRHSRMNQARSEEEEKERKRDRKDRGQEADGKKGKTKHI